MLKKIIATSLISTMALTMLAGGAVATTGTTTSYSEIVSTIKQVNLDLSKITEKRANNPLFQPETKEAIKNNSYSISGLTSLTSSEEIKQLLNNSNIPYNHRVLGNAAQVQRFIGTKTNFEYSFFYGSDGTLTFKNANFTKSQFLKVYPEATQYGDTYVYGSMKVAFRTSKNGGTIVSFEHFGLTKEDEEANEGNNSRGEQLSKILSSTNWQGTKVYDANNNDLTEENMNFIGLAKYEKETGFYEFFDKETGETRGDEGTFFITNGGEKRILISRTQNYQAVVDITELTDSMFTYKRMGKDKFGKDIEVFVDHVPYGENLSFTNGREVLNYQTGPIETAISGAKILNDTLWNGTKVIDSEGNDVTEANQMFISLAKFEKDTSKYEFFNLETGVTRGDYGYFDVINNNKIRAHVSIGANRYGAVLEITELTSKKFTYKRQGKDDKGNDIEVFVEHEPYVGEFNPGFTF